MTRRFALVDRDGTINVEKHYLSDPDDLELLPGAAEGLRRMQELGLGLVVVTNQNGVAKGLFDEARVKEINTRLVAMLKDEGVEVGGVYYCPHSPADHCDCRKPQPGMALQAARELGFDLTQAFMIGDKPADVMMGRAVGATTFLVRTGYGAKHEALGDAPADHVVNDLAEAAKVIAGLLQQGGETP
ncbi:MAG: HAD family hydrolase [Alphaproteobacteria bacterium RIFOXYD12_FULL_60_8]|nr:MAG: HAD family hydrolase [Alphaproteobacteria bacterium RIFOXYD12_FULL_60_8]